MGIFLQKFVSFFFGILSTLFGKKAVAYIAECIQPTMKISDPEGVELQFYTPGKMTFYRAESLFTKEPETIDWIKTFEPGDILFDVGANVGIYSLYAAKKRQAKVYSFEPTFHNFWLLNENIALNKLDQQIKAYAIGLSDKHQADEMFLPNLEWGGALTNIGESVDQRKNEFQAAHVQGVVTYSIDQLVGEMGFPCPQHIKIDVDGIEALILKGAIKTFASPQFKSLSVEINDNDEGDIKMLEELKRNGLNVKWKRHAPFMDQGEWKDYYNYVLVPEACH